jgi:N-ethylmaleimide reductase
MTNDQTASLFEPVTLGAIKLSNRVVMAPLTRSRQHLARALQYSTGYCAQRDSDGFIITEATQISF